MPRWNEYFSSDFNYTGGTRGYIYNNEDNKHLENEYRISFKSLYPNVILKLSNENILTFNNEAYKTVVLTLFKNYESIISENNLECSEKYLINFLKNYTYGFLNSKHNQYAIHPFKIISKYMTGYYELLKSLVPTMINGINVDEIYLNSLYNPEDLEDYSNICMEYFLDKCDMPYIQTKY